MNERKQAEKKEVIHREGRIDSGDRWIKRGNERTSKQKNKVVREEI